MRKEHRSTVDMVRTIAQSSQIKGKRSFADFFADRIVQASTEQTILGAVEKLCKNVDVAINDLYRPVVNSFFTDMEHGADVLAWMRRYPTIMAMLVILKKEEYEEAVAGISIDSAMESEGVALASRIYDIPIKISCVSAFAHGGDNKAGNATLFRRQSVLSDRGKLLLLPFYSGNALRGTMRDLLADHFLSSIGLIPRRDNPPVILWFFHVLYAGGVLEESGGALKAISDKLGKNGAIRSGGVYEFRDTLPHLSLLGAAMGNRIISGRAMFGDFRPRCQQYGTGEQDVSELFEWTFITRREDHEDHEVHHGMIANTECLRSGVIMDGGIDVSGHISDLEKSALGMGLKLLQEKGKLGAENRRGLGSVDIVIDNLPEPELYEDYLAENKKRILAYLEAINAIPSGQLDIVGY